MRSSRLIRAAVALALLAQPWILNAATPDPVPAGLEKTLRSRFTEVNILSIKPAPVAGLFEVFTGDSIAYANANGDFLLVGSLMDTRTHANLTTQRLDEMNSIDFAALPFDRAIKVVKGNGRRKLAIFADPDCPYCQQLEKEMASMTDVTVYTFLYPLERVHPHATEKAHAIWCATDRSHAWTQWRVEQRAPDAVGTCKDDPITALQQLGTTLRISSTPTLFLSNGRRIGGAVETEKLEKMLDASAAAPAASPPVGMLTR